MQIVVWAVKDVLDVQAVVQHLVLGVEQLVLHLVLDALAAVQVGANLHVVHLVILDAVVCASLDAVQLILVHRYLHVLDVLDGALVAQLVPDVADAQVHAQDALVVKAA